MVLQRIDALCVPGWRAKSKLLLTVVKINAARYGEISRARIIERSSLTGSPVGVSVGGFTRSGTKSTVAVPRPGAPDRPVAGEVMSKRRPSTGADGP